MGDKIKKQAKVKEPIRIRYKALNNGNQSIYLDFIMTAGGSMSF